MKIYRRNSGKALTALLLALFMATLGCSKKEEEKAKEAGPPKRPPVPVVSAKARLADFPVELSQMGTAEAVNSTPVKAQIGGAIVAANVRDGQNVSAGQLLFQIDSKTIEGNIKQLEADRDRWDAQIKTAEAQYRAIELQKNSAQAQAKVTQANVKAAENQVALADTQLKRYQSLADKEFVTREQLDQVKTTAENAGAALLAARSQTEAALAAVETAKANAEAAATAVDSAKASRAATLVAIENAKIQLGYTSIRSPISGQAGTLMADKGDYVKGNGDTTLVLINQLNPIQVKFALPESYLGDVRKYANEKSLKVSVEIPGQGQREGKLVFVDNFVDRTTGTITLKAEFENKDAALWPGQFLNVKIRLSTKENAVVVPSAAVQIGQRGPYVYTLGADRTATLKLVKPGLSGGGFTVIEEGVSKDDTVIVDGQLKVTQGAPTVEKPAPGMGAATGPKDAKGDAK